MFAFVRFYDQFLEPIRVSVVLTLGLCVQVSLWEVRLSDLDEYLLNLNAIQRRWVYLEPIFGRGALPREEARFKRVDEDFRSSFDIFFIITSSTVGGEKKHPHWFFNYICSSKKALKLLNSYKNLNLLFAISV